SRNGGRIFRFLLWIVWFFRGIVACRTWNEIRLHVPQQLRDLRRLGRGRNRTRSGGCLSWRRFHRACGSLAVTESDIRGEQRHVGMPLAFGLNGIFVRVFA